MSKAIKIDEESYEQITNMLQGRDTYADVVKRLLAIAQGVRQFIAENQILPEYRKQRIDRPEMGKEVKDGTQVRP